jgi:hypothetical protein
MDDHFGTGLPWIPDGVSGVFGIGDLVLAPKSGDAVKVTEAPTDDRAVRNIHVSTSDPSASDGDNGDIWLKYSS